MIFKSMKVDVVSKGVLGGLVAGLVKISWEGCLINHANIERN